MPALADSRSDRRPGRPSKFLLLGLAVLIVVIALLGRYSALECHTEFYGSVTGTRSEPVADGGQGTAVGGGCYVLDRWTGQVRYRVAF